MLFRRWILLAHFLILGEWNIACTRPAHSMRAYFAGLFENPDIDFDEAFLFHPKEKPEHTFDWPTTCTVIRVRPHRGWGLGLVQLYSFHACPYSLPVPITMKAILKPYPAVNNISVICMAIKQMKIQILLIDNNSLFVTRSNFHVIRVYLLEWQVFS